MYTLIPLGEKPDLTHDSHVERKMKTKHFENIETPQSVDFGVIYRLHMIDRSSGEISRTILSEDYTEEEAKKTNLRWKEFSTSPDDLVTLKVSAEIVF